jgi:hypothetical protein
MIHRIRDTWAVLRGKATANRWTPQMSEDLCDLLRNFSRIEFRHSERR